MAPKRNATRQAKKAATREGLKKAAIACFREGGYAQTRIGNITKAAGVAQGTFYVHFPSKEALLDELLAEFNEGLVARLTPVWLDGTDAAWRERIRHTAETFLDHWEDNRGFVEIYAERVAAGLTVAALRDGINPEAAGLMTEQLAAFVGARGLSPSAALLVVQGLLALWARIGLQCLFNDDVNRDDAVAALERLTVGALEGVLPGGGQP